jgi:hypothetical protein
MQANKGQPGAAISLHSGQGDCGPGPGLLAGDERRIPSPAQYVTDAPGTATAGSQHASDPCVRDDGEGHDDVLMSSAQETPILPEIEVRWVLTVRGLLMSSSATCSFDFPWATRRSTSTSRAVNHQGKWLGD